MYTRRGSARPLERRDRRRDKEQRRPRLSRLPRTSRSKHVPHVHRVKRASHNENPTRTRRQWPAADRRGRCFRADAHASDAELLPARLLSGPRCPACAGPVRTPRTGASVVASP